MNVRLKQAAPETAPGFPELAKKEPRRVLFVCSGNTCRSPMAAAVTNALGKSAGMLASSAGTCPRPGEPISRGALDALLGAGYTPLEGNRFDAHEARTVDAEMLESSDLVVAISTSHMLSLIYSFPAFTQKITVMPRDIPDPFGGDAARYRECLCEITRGVKELFGFETENGAR